jgi:hypothetical protein
MQFKPDLLLLNSVRFHLKSAKQEKKNSTDYNVHLETAARFMVSAYLKEF